METDWARVGTAVRARRLEVDLTQKEAATAAGVSDTTWLTLESGRQVSARTVRGACRALRWTPHSIDYILGGGDPVEVEPENTDDVAELRAEVARLRQIVERWGTPPGEQR